MTAPSDADSGTPQPWRWAIGNIELEVRVGNLLEAPETYLVNSENSAFRLAVGTHSISGQFRRAHPIMQAELDVQTRHQWLPEGSVLETSGPGGHRVYHAGFHALDGWMTNGAEDEVAYYAANIERCVEKILESVAAIEAEDRRRVAFPLIGTGSFRLPEAVSARLFFAAVAVRARASAPRMHVALVVRDQMTLESVVRAGTQVLAGLVDGGEPVLKHAGGHPMVQQLRARPRRLADPLLQEHALLQFAELATLVELCTLWDLQSAPIEQFFRRFKVPASQTGTLSFGTIAQLITLDLEVGGDIARLMPDWARDRAAAWRAKTFCDAIRRLVEDRNHLAHNRAPRGVSDVVADIELLFGSQALPEAWPCKAGRFWIRDLNGATAVIESVDVKGRRCTWLRPLRRDRVSEALAV
jgi:hypothetical protein